MRISDWSSDVCSSDLTNTRRYGVIASLNYDINDDHHVRLAYTWDRARHRQTGSTNLLQLNGEPIDVFPINNPLETVDGFVLNKRDRLPSRSEERRVGKGCVSPCKSRGSRSP